MKSVAFAARALAMGAALLSFMFATARADEVSEWPKRDVTIVFPFAPGAGQELTARMIADHLTAKFGQKFIVDNRAGAGGALGMGFVARQAPDGYTLVVGTPGPAANYTNSYQGLPYKPLEDFTPIMQLTSDYMTFVARADFPAKDLKELVAYAKANPGKVNVGHPGIGSYGHMLGLTFGDQSGITFNYVPYRGSALIVQDLLSGSIDIGIDVYGGTYDQQVKAGKIRNLGFASAARPKEFPDVPTFMDQGYNMTAAPWTGLYGPKGLPAPIVEKLRVAITDFLNQPEAIAKIKGVNTNPAPTTTAEFNKIWQDEEAKWRATIKKYDIRSN